MIRKGKHPEFVHVWLVDDEEYFAVSKKPKRSRIHPGKFIVPTGLVKRGETPASTAWRVTMRTFGLDVPENEFVVVRRLADFRTARLNAGGSVTVMLCPYRESYRQHYDDYAQEIARASWRSPAEMEQLFKQGNFPEEFGYFRETVLPAADALTAMLRAGEEQED